MRGEQGASGDEKTIQIKEEVLGKIKQLSMADYPSLNCNSQEKIGMGSRAQERPTGNPQSPLPSSTPTPKDTQRVTHTAPYILIPVKSGENGLQAQPLQGEMLQRASEGKGGAEGERGEQPAGFLLLCCVEGPPLAISFLWWAPHAHTPVSSHLLVDFYQRKEDIKAAAVQPSRRRCEP